MLKGLGSDNQRSTKLAELNVIRGVETIMGNYVVEDAIKERGLKVHGVIYDIGVGKLKDLSCGNAEVKGKGQVDGAVDVEDGVEVRGNHGMLVFGSGQAKMAIR